MQVIEVPIIHSPNTHGRFVLRNHGAATNPGAYSRLVLVFDSTTPPYPGETLQLDLYDATSVNFTFNGDYAIDANLIDYYDGTETPIRNYFRRLASQIQAHPSIQKDYIVSFLDGFNGTINLYHIQIQAINQGDYSIVKNAASTVYLHYALAITGNPNNLSGTHRAEASLYLLTGYPSNTTEYRSFTSISYPVYDADTNIADFEFYDLLKSIVINPDLSPPVSSGVALVKNGTSLFNFTAREIISGMTLPATLNWNGDSVFAYDQRLNAFPLYHSVAEEALTLRSHLDQGKFLTKQPRKKIIRPDQLEWLYWPSGLSAADATFTITVYFSDGTNSIVSNTIPVQPYCIYCFATGYEMNRLADIMPGKTVVYYEAFVTDSMNEVGEKFTYIMEYKDAEDTKYLIFQNTFGGYDTMRFSGSTKTAVKRTGSTIPKVQTESSTAKDGTIIMDRQTLDGSLILRSGYMPTFTDLRYYKELFGSSNVYEARAALPEGEDSRRYQPLLKSLIHDSETTDLIDDTSGLRAIEAKFKYAYPDAHVYQGTPAKVYYSGRARVSVRIHSIAGPNPRIQVYNPGGNNKITVNGNLYGGTFIAYQDVVYDIILESDDFNTLAITVNDCISTLTVLELDAVEMDFIELIATNVTGSYLLKRLPYLPKLTNLKIFASDDFDIDSTMAAASRLYGHYHVLTVIVFTNKAPGVLGNDLKNYLIAQGLFVVTA